MTLRLQSCRTRRMALSASSGRYQRVAHHTPGAQCPCMHASSQDRTYAHMHQSSNGALTPLLRPAGAAVVLEG